VVAVVVVVSVYVSLFVARPRRLSNVAVAVLASDRLRRAVFAAGAFGTGITQADGCRSSIPQRSGQARVVWGERGRSA
jgi:hypothetical protein